jgi:protein-S-isoprenylcysteine O-methyltransferase Ste14
LADMRKSAGRRVSPIRAHANINATRLRLVHAQCEVVCAALVLVAVAVPRWVRPWWIRWAIALLLTLTDAYIFGWGNALSPIPWLPTIIHGGFDF